MVRNNKGFSLIELMVVVAIIGILTTIAVPSINRYMARARQSEAKGNLAGIYTANKAFYAEFNMYSGDFGVIAYGPEGKLRYNAGFTGAGGCTPANHGFTGAATSVYDTKGFCTANATKCTTLSEGQQSVTGSVTCADATSGSATFIAEAAGKIGNSANIDTWQITDAKLMTNTKDGTQ